MVHISTHWREMFKSDRSRPMDCGGGRVSETQPEPPAVWGRGWCCLLLFPPPSGGHEGTTGPVEREVGEVGGRG